MAFKSPRASLLGHIGFLDMYALVRRTITRSQVAIIMYHHITPVDNPLLTSAVSVQDFEREIAFLHKVADIVPLDVLADKLRGGQSIPRKTVCITFDDGYKDNYEYAYPILRKYDVPATVFLTTGYVESGNTFWDDKVRFVIWNTNIEEFVIEGLGYYRLTSASERGHVIGRIVGRLLELPDAEKDLLVARMLEKLKVVIPRAYIDDISLTWREIREMSNNGISFGAHTVTHPILTKVSLEDARTEITLSKKAIEEKLGIPCTLFAYPNGGFNDELIGLVREAGFTCAVTTIARLIANNVEPLMLGRLDAGPNYYGFKYNFSGLAQDLAPIVNFLSRR